MFGLNADPTTNSSYISIDYAFYCDLGNLRIYESGANRGTFGTYTPTSVLSITYDGQNIRYWRDGTLIRTVARAIGTPLYLDSSFYNINSELNSVGFGPMGEIGTQGVQGRTGIQGLAGTTQGAQGTQGRQGTQGLSGLIGGQGTQGTQGRQGRQGVQGRIGSQGVQGAVVTTTPSTITKTVFTATAGQTVFNVAYGIQYVLVYLNGSHLQENADYTATSGTSVVLSTGASAGDIVEVVYFNLGNFVRGIQGVGGSFSGQGIQGTQGIQGRVGQGIQGSVGSQGSTTTLSFTNDSASTGTHYPVFVAGSGNRVAKVRTTATAFSFIPNTGNLVVPGTVTASSDRSLKTRISEIKDPLEKVLKLRGVEFTYKSHGGRSIGLIAQEVEKVLPELVSGDKLKSVAYQNLVAVLIEAIKELNTKVDDLNDKYENIGLEGGN
jgi:hypothetical protein